MATKATVEDVRMNSETGELEFAFQKTDDGKPEPTPEAKEAEVQNFAQGELDKALQRYKAVQSWATRINQEKLELEKRVNRLEQKRQQDDRPAPAAIPTADDPGLITQDTLEDPELLKGYFVDLIKANLDPLNKVLEERLKPLENVTLRIQQQDELTEAVSRYRDFGEWRNEMLDISKNLPDDTEMTFSELYVAARGQHPEKAIEIDEKYELMALESAQVSTPTEPDVPAKNSDTDSAAPEDPDNNADAGSQPDVGVDLKAKAERLAVETGVDGGNDPQPSSADLQSAFDAAWEEVAAS